MRTHTKKTAFDYIIIVILLAVCFACIYPMWYIGVNSFAAPEVANRGASAWWPSAFSLDAYKVVFENEYIGGGGFGNNEQQYYTGSTDNAFIRDGSLVLKAIQGEYGGEWPICGEIDIMEYMGSDTDTVLGTLHYGNPWVYNTGYYNLENGGSFASGYHDFAMEWLPGEIRWYVDGELYQIQQNWYSTDATGTYAYPAPFDQELYLMLNLAVGGYFPGDPVPSDWTSTEFAIDYVRVYEYTGELVPTEQEGQAPNVNLLANPGFDTDLSGWETWTENGSVFSCSEGCLRADIYTTLPNTWSTQFYQNVDVYSGTEYRLSFKVRSSVSLDDISLCRIN